MNAVLTNCFLVFRQTGRSLVLLNVKLLKKRRLLIWEVDRSEILKSLKTAPNISGRCFLTKTWKRVGALLWVLMVVIFMKGTSRTITFMEEAELSSRMVLFTRGNGRMIHWMASARWPILKVTFLSGPLLTIKEMGKVRQLSIKLF